MRKAPLLAGMALVLGVSAVRAQDVPYDAVVAVPEVEVRSGPSQQFYATSKLRLNDPVRVLKKVQDGWLAIVPPKGSFNWINGRFLEPAIRSGQTSPVYEEATLLIGSAVVNNPPTSRSQVKVQKGAQVVILGEPMTDAEGKWWPIQPPPQEVRYLPADAVQGNQPVQPAAASVPPVGRTGGTLPPATPAQVFNDPLWLQAEQAERDNNPALAVGLYTKLSRQPTTDHELMLRCQNRIESLNQKLRASAAAPVNANYPPPAGSDPRIPAAPNTNPQPAPAAPVPQAIAPVTPGSAPAPAAGQPPAPQQLLSFSGTLRRSGVQLNNQMLFALDMPGQLMYVAPQPDLNLEALVYCNVELQGTAEYKGQLNTWLITVKRVIRKP